MNENENMMEIPSWRFHSQWDEFFPTEGQSFMEPSLTIPDQSMTIPEIIARFTRTGQLPGSVKMIDQGGNIAADPESDPLDDYSAVQAAAAAAKAAGSSKDPSVDPSGEPDSPAPAPAGA